MAKTIAAATGFEVPDIAAYAGSSGTAPTISTVTPRTGSRCLRCAATAGTSRLNLTNGTALALGGGTRGSYRFGFRIETLPSVTTEICFGNTGSGNLALTLTSGGVIKAQMGTAGTLQTGPTLSINRWYVIEFEANTSIASNWNLNWKVDNLDQTASNNTAVATTPSITAMALGNTTSTTFAFLYDDFANDSTAGEYPIGNGYGVLYPINASGSHTITTGVFKDEAAATITAGESTSYTHVSETTPDGATSYVNQTTAKNTDFLEYAFTNTSTSDTPQFVRTVIQSASSAAAAGSGAAKAHDSSTDTSIATNSSTTYAYHDDARATRSGAQGALTTGAIDAMTVRIGYATSVATAVVRLSYAALEVDYATPYLFTADPLSVSGSGAITVASSLRIRTSGSIAVSGAAAITIAAAAHTSICGALVVAGTNVGINISASEVNVPSGLVSVSGAGQITILAANETVLSGTVVVAGSGAITIASTLQRILSGAVVLDADGEITISDSKRITFSGLLVVSGEAAIFVVDTDVIVAFIRSGVLNVSGDDNINAIKIRVLGSPRHGRPNVDATYVRNFGTQAHRRIRR